MNEPEPPPGGTAHGTGAAPPYNSAVKAGNSALPSLMELPNLAADDLGDLHQSMADLVKGVIRTNLRLSQEMLRVTSPSEFVALQQRFIHDYMAALMHGSLQLVVAMQRETANTVRLDRYVEQGALQSGDGRSPSTEGFLRGNGASDAP